MAGIHYIDYHLPPNYKCAKDLITCADQIQFPATYRDVHHFAEDFCALSKLSMITHEDRDKSIDIFTSLLDKLFQNSSVKPADIGCIVFTDVNNNYIRNGVNVPFYVKEKFGMENACILNLNQECTGSIWAMALSDHLLKQTRSKFLLILSSCFVSDDSKRFIDVSVTGDAVGIMVLTSEPSEASFVDFLSAADGANSLDLYHDQPIQSGGLSIFARGAEVIEELLERNDLAKEDVTFIVPQSLHDFVYTSVYPKLLDFPPDRITVKNIPNGGHLGDVGILRNLKDSLSGDEIPGNSYFLVYAMAAFGQDFGYNCLLMRKS